MFGDPFPLPVVVLAVVVGLLIAVGSAFLTQSPPVYQVLGL